MTLLIARITFREAVRKKMILGVLLLSAVFVGMYAFGYVKFHEDFMSRVARRPNNPAGLSYEVFASMLVIMGFYVVNFLTGVMAIFTAVGAISAEIEGHTLDAIVPKPLRRSSIVLGKWLGYAAMLTIYVILMTGSVMATAWIVGGYIPPAPAFAVAMVTLVALLLLSLTVLGSTVLSTITNGIVVFMLYGIALTGGLVEQIGTVLDNQIMKTLGIIASLAIPSDVIWKLAAYVLQPATTLSFGPTPFTPAAAPSSAMVAYAVGYAVLALAGAVAVFGRRDL
ncbi:MAG: ABC transporter permease subunit [Chloroflexi bacterium]|nr:ABC transporter permease subunit [Chloroflexota bacterium]